MNRKTFIKWINIVYIIGLLFGFNLVVSGEEKKSPLEGFSYEVILPENQHNKEVGYYDLRMAPGQQQIVQMKLTNTSDREIVVDVRLNGAKTNGNGVIEYGPNELENDASLKYDFVDVVTAPERVTLAPKSEQLLDIQIQMPEVFFEGYISGGIELQEVINQAEQKKESGMIINEFAYLTGMLLSEDDVDGIKPEMQLNKIYPELKNFQTAIFVNFSNVQPVYAEGMTVDVQIMKKDSEQVLYDSKKSKMRMAPNTMIDFPVTLGERMVAGDYRAKIIVTTVDNGRWEWEQEFTITNEEAEKFNEQDLTLVKSSGINWLLIGAIVGGSLLFILIVFLLVRLINKGKRKATQKHARKRRSK